MRSFTSAKVARQVQLDQYAWRNRRAPTESEARLWEALRGRKLGVQFRRQVPLCGQYIVDFVAPAARLVVEVDGSSHANRWRADERRDRKLARLGYRVLRLPAVLVMLQTGVAIHRVVEALPSLPSRESAALQTGHAAAQARADVTGTGWRRSALVFCRDGWQP